MNKSPAVSPDARLFGLVVLVILYSAGYLMYYIGTPLGQVPLLDGRETLDLAEDIASGDLPAEPFYRMPLYAAVLGWTHIPALVLNFICHLVSTVLIYQIARRLYFSGYGPLVAGLLYGVNPVVLYFVGDPLDVTFGIMLMVVGLYFASHCFARRRLADVLLAGCFFTLAGFARGHMLMLAFFWPCLVWFLVREGRLRYFMSAGLPVVVGFLVFGSINYRLSGEFVLLPTQGAYNFYAANKLGSHGKYFVQDGRSVDLRHEGNPTRSESLALYAAETGKPAESIAEANAYWRSKILRSFWEDPVRHAKQFFWKLYYLLNNTEQYNNKTYAVHKELSPWLKYNPLGFGILLVLCYFGVLLNYKNRHTLLLGSFSDVLSVGVLLFFVSARFRLPLVVFLCIFAGAIFAYKFKKPLKRTSFYIASAGALIIMGVTFSSFGGVDDRRSHAEDYALLAGAEFHLGNDVEALVWAGKALEVNGSHPKALELLCLTQFNQILELGELPSRKELEVRIQRFAPLTVQSPQVRYVLGYYLYRLEKTDTAIQIWRSLAGYSNEARMDAAAALSAVGVRSGVGVKSEEVEAFRALLKLPFPG